MTYSLDLRQRVVDAYKNDEGSYAKIARRFCVSVGSVQKWVKNPDPPAVETRGRPPALDAQDLERLRTLACQHPDATETELATMLAPQGHKPLHRSIINRAMRKMKLTVKKRRGAQANSCEKTCKTTEESG